MLPFVYGYSALHRAKPASTTPSRKRTWPERFAHCWNTVCKPHANPAPNSERCRGNSSWLGLAAKLPNNAAGSDLSPQAGAFCRHVRKLFGSTGSFKPRICAKYCTYKYRENIQPISWCTAVSERARYPCLKPYPWILSANWQPCCRETYQHYTNKDMSWRFCEEANWIIFIAAPDKIWPFASLLASSA